MEAMAALDSIEPLPALSARREPVRSTPPALGLAPSGSSSSATPRRSSGSGSTAATSRRVSGDVLTSIARITGLLSAYLALIQVILLARVPALERLVGFDRLSVWHRWNGHACLDLVLAHVFFSVWGYALLDKFSIPKEISTMLGGGIYPGMITATVGTALLIAVVATSIVIVRRRLRYEWWYAVHLLAYAGIALAWFHQIPTGNELVLDTVAADYWRALYVATIALLVAFRVGAPVVAALRYRLRVAAVVDEGPGVVSLWITGRGLDRLHAPPGSSSSGASSRRGRWWKAHPFSLSAAPDGRSLRITVKALGDDTARHRRRSPSARASSPKGRSASSPTSVAPAREGAAHRGRHRHHARARADAGDARRRRRALPRRRRRRHRLPRRARRSSHARAAPSCTTSSATTPPTKAGTACSRTICSSSFPTSPSGRSTSVGRPRSSTSSPVTSARPASRAGTSTPNVSLSERRRPDMRKRPQPSQRRDASHCPSATRSRASADAAAPSRRRRRSSTVTKTVSGRRGEADRWGPPR